MVVQFGDVDDQRLLGNRRRQAATQRADIIKKSFIIVAFSEGIVRGLIVDPPFFAGLCGSRHLLGLLLNNLEWLEPHRPGAGNDHITTLTDLPLNFHPAAT